MAYIGLISDTHGVFDERVREFLQPVDQIWHAGDFGNVQTMDAIASFKPLVGVYGNCDDQTIRRCQPYTQSFTIEGMKILMMHIGGYPFRYDYKALQLIYALQPDIFVCGHSHILRVMNDKKIQHAGNESRRGGNHGNAHAAYRTQVQDRKRYCKGNGSWRMAKIHHARRRIILKSGI